MAITLTTEWQKVLETSTKVTQNVTGYLRLYMKYGGRNETNNKDIVYYEIRQYAYNPYGNYLAWEWTGDLSWNIKLGTTTKASGSYKQTPAIYSDGKERVRASGNWEQEHNPDGTWTSSISVEGYVYQTKLSASGDIILPTIPRKTTISVTNSSINGISIITLYKNSDSFYHTLYYRNPNTNEKINIKTNYKDKTYEWPVPDDIYKVMSGREIRLTIGCDTYNSSGGLVGNDEKPMVASAVELDARPTFSATIKNDGTSGKTYQLTGSEVAFIKDYTNAIIDTTIGLRKYATLKEFKVTNGNKSSTLEDTTIDAIPTKTFTFHVKDSREYFPTQGYPFTQNVDIFIDYFTPKVNSPNIARTEQTSTEVVANISGQFWNGNFGKVQNTLKYAWRSKLAGSNEWGVWSSFTPLTTSNNNFSISNLSLGTTYATNSSYDFQFQFIDELGNLDSSKIVTTATQNVTISTPIVEVYEDAVVVNGNLFQNSTNIGEHISDLYSRTKAGSHKTFYRGEGGYAWQKLAVFSVSGDCTIKIEGYSNVSAIGRRGHFEILVSTGTNNEILNVVNGNNYINATNFDYRKLSDGTYEIWFYAPQWTRYNIWYYYCSGYVPSSFNIIYYQVGTPTGTKLMVQYSMNLYSTTEQCIGTWFNGKPLYQKTIDFGNLPNNTYKSVAHGIANVEDIWIDKTGSYFVDTRYHYYDVSDFEWHCNVDRTNVNIETTMDRTSAKAIVTIRYTKTTN